MKIVVPHKSYVRCVYVRCCRHQIERSAAKIDATRRHLISAVLVLLYYQPASTMNPSAAEWRPDTNAARGDSLADPAAAIPSTSDSSMPPTIFQKLSDDLATATLSFLSDVPFELDETSYKCTLTHTLPIVCKRIRALVSEGDEIWRAGLERMIAKEATWRDAAKKIYAENTEQLEQEQQQGVAARGDNERNRTTYAQIGNNNNCQRIFVGVQEVGTDDENDNDEMELDEVSDEEDNGDATTAADDGDSESAKSIIDMTCKALGDSSVPCTCKQLFRRIVQRLRFRSPIFYMPGPVTMGNPLACTSLSRDTDYLFRR